MSRILHVLASERTFASIITLPLHSREWMLTPFFNSPFIDEGALLRTKFTPFNLRNVGIEAIEKIHFRDLRMTGGDDGISVSVNLVGEGGSTALNTDRQVLLRVLQHLLENAVREVNPGGSVTLQITSSPPSATNSEGSVLVEIMDDGKGLPPGTCLEATVSGIGDVNGGSHRYVIGNRGNQDDPDELQKARAEMEEGLRNLKQNGVGVGLPVSYHLVRMLGGDLRHDAEFSGGTRIWFTLPNKIEAGDEDDQYEVLKTETVPKKGLPPTQISFAQSGQSDNKSASVRTMLNLANLYPPIAQLQLRTMVMIVLYPPRNASTSI